MMISMEPQHISRKAAPTGTQGIRSAISELASVIY
jgi:hypothetical protein